MTQPNIVGDPVTATVSYRLVPHASLISVYASPVKLRDALLIPISVSRI